MAAPRRDSGDGSIWFDADRKRWRAEIDYGMVDGRRQRRRLSFKTRSEARSAAADAAKAKRDGLPPPDGKIRVGAYLDEWLATRVEPSRRAENTKVSYRAAVRLHIGPALGHVRLVDLRHKHVVDLLGGMAKNGKGESLMKTALVVLRQALKQAVKDDRLVRNVADGASVPVPQVRRPAPRRLTHDERNRVYYLLYEHRLFAAFYVMTQLGLRKGEALGLRDSDLDFEAMRVNVLRQLVRVTGAGLITKEPKRGQVRSLHMSQVTARVLKSHLARRQAESEAAGASWVDSGFLFTSPLGQPVDPAVPNRLLAELTRQALGTPATPHSLRRTFSDEAHEGGGKDKAIMTAMGHRDIGVTMNTYVSSRPATQRELAEIMDGTLKDVPELFG